MPPSPGQNNSGAQTVSAAKKSVFKRNKDGGVDKYAVDFLVVVRLKQKELICHDFSHLPASSQGFGTSQL